MSNFKKYMSIIRESEVNGKEGESIEKEFNFNDIYENNIEGKLKIDSRILPIELRTSDDHGLLLIKSKKEITPEEITPKEITPKEITPKEITPKEINIEIKLGEKWVSIFDTHQETYSKLYKDYDINKSLERSHLDFITNMISKNPQFPVNPRTDSFFDVAINSFVNKYNAEFNSNVDYDVLRKDENFKKEFNEFIRLIHLRLKTNLSLMLIKLNKKYEKKDINTSN